MMPIYIYSGIVISVVLVLFIMAGSKYKVFIEENQADFQVLFMAPASLCLIDKLRLMKRFSSRLSRVQQKITIIYGGRQIPQYTKMFIAQNISIVLITLLGSAIFVLISGGDSTFVYFGLILAVVIPFVGIKKIDEKLDKRKKVIIYELPEFTSKVALLVNAGETVQNAIIRCVTTHANDDNALYIELKHSVNQLQNGESFAQVMEEFGKRCGVQEVSALVTTILLNYRRGGSELSLALRESSRDLWEKRKAISKTRGEEASSKLVFPMILTLLAVLIVIAFPALKVLG